MVKLPVVLGEFTMGWERCIDESLKLQAYLESEAAYESDYTRPIVLIQAQQKGMTPSPDEVKRYLMDVSQIPEERIAIATGTQKDLDGKDLFALDCSIRYVITMKALKEGWDCSFAYVLCSLQNISSAKDVEQLLGRVLRMPFARKRIRDSLNKAYANVVSEQTMLATTFLRDQLVQTMGFNQLEAQEFVEESVSPEPEQGTLWPSIGDGAEPTLVQTHPIVLQSTKSVEEVQSASKEAGVQWKIEEREANGKKLFVVHVPENVKPENLRKMVQVVSKGASKDMRESNENAVSGLFAAFARTAAQKNQATPFPEMPRLCYTENGVTKLLTDQTILTEGWNPNSCSFEVEFHPTYNAERFEIDMDESKKLVKRHLEELELPLQYARVERDANGLIAWLAPQVRRNEVPANLMKSFIRTVIGDMMGAKGFTLDELYLHKVELARAITNRLERNYKDAISDGFQTHLKFASSPDDSEDTRNSPVFFYKFDPGYYTPRNVYDPRGDGIDFKKHMCTMIHDLRVRTPSGNKSEEYLCAEAIEENRHVKRWIRNIENSEYSFFLPIGSHRFYPDFIVELTNGTILVIEYKGENLYTNGDSQIKLSVGTAWEKANKGKCFFLMARKKDDSGLLVAAQIQRKIDEAMKESA